MKTVVLDHMELRSSVRFTDPFYGISPTKEEEIIQYHEAGELRPPALIEHEGKFLIFNGNHRVLIAINRHLDICCIVLEDLADVLQAQVLEGENATTLPDVEPLSFEAVVDDLVQRADKVGEVDPARYAYE